MTDKSGMALLDGGVVVDIIERKLRSGWCIVYGAHDAIIALEEQVFTPGTSANSDFIAFMLPLFPPPPLYLARKTDGLKHLFPKSPPVTEDEWEHVVAIELADADTDGITRVVIRMMSDLSRTGELARLAVAGGFR